MIERNFENIHINWIIHEWLLYSPGNAIAQNMLGDVEHWVG